jgi:hypothetical protein
MIRYIYFKLERMLFTNLSCTEMKKKIILDDRSLSQLVQARFGWQLFNIKKWNMHIRKREKEEREREHVFIKISISNKTPQWGYRLGTVIGKKIATWGLNQVLGCTNLTLANGFSYGQTSTCQLHDCALRDSSEHVLVYTLNKKNRYCSLTYIFSCEMVESCLHHMRNW